MSQAKLKVGNRLKQDNLKPSLKDQSQLIKPMSLAFHHCFKWLCPIQKSHRKERKQKLSLQT